MNSRRTIIQSCLNIIALVLLTLGCGKFQVSTLTEVGSEQSLPAATGIPASYPPLPNVQPGGVTQVEYIRRLSTQMNIEADVWEVRVNGSSYAIKIPKSHEIPDVANTVVPSEYGGLPNGYKKLTVNAPPNLGPFFSNMKYDAIIMDLVPNAATPILNNGQPPTPTQIKKLNDIFRKIHNAGLVPHDPNLGNILIHPNGIDIYLIDNQLNSASGEIANLGGFHGDVYARNGTNTQQAANVKHWFEGFRKYWKANPELLDSLPAAARQGLSEAEEFFVTLKAEGMVADLPLSESISKMIRVLSAGKSSLPQAQIFLAQLHKVDPKDIEKLADDFTRFTSKMSKLPVAVGVATSLRASSGVLLPYLEKIGRAGDLLQYAEILEIFAFNMILGHGPIRRPDVLFQNLVNATEISICSANPTSPICRPVVQPQRTVFEGAGWGWIYNDPSDPKKIWAVHDAGSYSMYDSQVGTLEGAAVDDKYKFTDYFASPLGQCPGWYQVHFKDDEGRSLGRYYARVSNNSGRTAMLELSGKIETDQLQNAEPACPRPRIQCAPPMVPNESETACVCGNDIEETQCSSSGDAWFFAPADPSGDSTNACSCKSKCTGPNQLISTDNTCKQCRENQNRSADGKACSCKENPGLASGSTCGTYGTWNATMCFCACPTGYGLDPVTRKCIPINPSTARVDEVPIVSSCPPFDWYCECKWQIDHLMDPSKIEPLCWQTLGPGPGQLSDVARRTYANLPAGSPQFIKIQDADREAPVKVSRFFTPPGGNVQFKGSSSLGKTDSNGELATQDPYVYNEAAIGLWRLEVSVGSRTQTLTFTVVRPFKKNPVILSVRSAGLVDNNTRSLVEINGTGFLSAGVSVRATCDGIATGTEISPGNSTTLIVARLSATSTNRNCTVAVISNGVESNSMSLAVPGYNAVTPPPAANAPNILGIKHLGFSDGVAKNIVEITGQNFSTSGTSVKVTCDGILSAANVLGVYNGIQIFVSMTSGTLNRACLFTINSNGRDSNSLSLAVPGSGALTPPQLPAPSISALKHFGFGESGTKNIIEIAGSNFQGSGTLVKAVCDGANTAATIFQGYTSTMMYVTIATANSNRNCFFTVNSNQRDSNSMSLTIPGAAVAPPQSSAPSLSNLKYLGFGDNGASSYVLLEGANFGSSDTSLRTVCNGISTQTNPLPGYTTTQMFARMAVASFGRNCNLSVLSNGKESNSMTVYIPGN